MKQQNNALTKFKEEIASELHVDLKNGAENTFWNFPHGFLIIKRHNKY